MRTISSLTAYIKEFGLKIFVSKTVRRCFYKSNSKLAWKVNDYNEKLIATYLEKQFNDTSIDVDNYLQYKNVSVPEKPIWMLWWQGEENAPEIVKCCINSVRKNCNGHTVIVLSQSNISDYIRLPDYIYPKVEKGYITRTHLSNFIRLNLLYLYGGAWIDATIFVSKAIPEQLFQEEFYSIRTGLKTKEPSHGRWTTFCMFGKEGNVIFKQILRYLYGYWNSHNVLIDYILFDYTVNYVVTRYKNCYEQINKIPLNNCNVFELFKILNDVQEDWVIDNLDDNTIFYKLSYKHKLLKDIKGKKTIYGKLLEELI